MKRRISACLYYRQLQWIGILCNQCFQIYVWPTVELIGGSALITLLYVLLVYYRQLPFSVVAGIIYIKVAVILACCLMLDMGSMSMLISGKILNEIHSWNECKYSHKIAKSCTPIALKIGDFHTMDRQRAPSFIRYVTQRTFAIVMKTKMSLDFKSDYVFSLPT